MPVKTTTLATDPVLVQQHHLSVLLDSNTSKAENSNRVFSATVLTYGATLTHLTVPDRWNQPQDVVLGFDHWEDYLAQAEPGALNPYFGAIIGRTASRIAHASFNVESKYAPAPAPGDAVSKSASSSTPHSLKVSNGLDCHHGGPLGFDKQYWTTLKTSADQDREEGTEEPAFVTLQLISPHGQNGYPGRLVSKVKYLLTSLGELVIEYQAQLEANPSSTAENQNHASRSLDLHSTIVSLTNHSYWNLDGVLNPPEKGSQDALLKAMEQRDAKEAVVLNPCSVKDHLLWLSTGKIIELGDAHPVPTGRILDLYQQHLQGTSVGSGSDSGDVDATIGKSLLDFRSAKRLGPGLEEIPGGYGYDHVYALNPPPSSATPVSVPSSGGPAFVSDIGIQGFFPSAPHVATLISSRTGIRLDLFTSEPALVLYAGGYLDNTKLQRTKSRLFELPDSSQSFFISPSANLLSQAERSSNNDERKTAKESTITIVAEMDKFAGVCLEPIRYPDAIHHKDWAGMVTLHHDQVYRQRSMYKFSVN